MAVMALRAESVPFNPIPLADRAAIEYLISVLISVLDILDGEADLEDDDPSGVADEDGYNIGDPLITFHGIYFGCGCPISDPDEDCMRQLPVARFEEA